MTCEPDEHHPISAERDDQATRTSADAPRPRTPKQIGQFHVKGVLASGGMGVVYRAVQDQPRRTVAVKVMKHGIASRSAMRRFEYESQILARLHHPGIAQVFEAGTYDDGSGGVPYFAMEYIPNAKPITQFSAEKKLTTRERLKLFCAVCDAVHHGHQKGIIHRDLKPDNILVDPRGEVKIIDFGVARGTDSDLAVTTLQTDVGQLVGTLQYMSPEQCEADPDAIDARSDVYALGIVLYELVSGQLPYIVSRKHVFDGTQIIREHLPTKLSTINRTLRGDVETIVLKVLEKDRDRRYQSAATFAQDIRSYLADEAIRARPPSAIYRVRLFTRRHQASVGALAGVVLVSAVAALLVMKSRENVERAENLVAAALRRATAAEKAAAASRVPDAPKDKKPEDLIGGAPPSFALTTIEGKPLGTADLKKNKATVLNFVALNCPFSLMQIPKVELIRADYESKGVRFVNVVEPMLGKVFSVKESLRMLERIHCNIELAKDDNKKVGNLFGVRGYPCLFVLDQEGAVSHVMGGNREKLASQLRGRLDSVLHGIPTPEEKLAESESLLRQTLEDNTRTLGEGHPDTLRSMENLATNLTLQGKDNEAESLYQTIWYIRDRLLGPSDPKTIESMHQYGVVLQNRGKPDRAEAVHRQALAARRRLLGEDHPDTRLSMAHLGLALYSQGKTQGARPYIAELIKLRKRAAEAQDAGAVALNEYAWLLLTCEPADLRDPQAALIAAREAVRLSGRQERMILDTLALAFDMTGNTHAAIETQKEGLRLFSADEWKRAEAFEKTLVHYCQKAGDDTALEQYYRDKLARARALDPPNPFILSLALQSLGEHLLTQDQFSEAETLYRECLPLAMQALPEDHWGVARIRAAIGGALAGQGRFEEGEQLVVQACDRILASRGVPSDVRSFTLDIAIRMYEREGLPDKAERYRALRPANNGAALP